MQPLPIDDETAPLYTVGQVADMLEVQQAFLRRLDDEDVVTPARSPGGQRRYSRREIGLVARVRRLLDEGLSLAGARRVVALERRVADLEGQLDAARAAESRTPSRTAGKETRKEEQG